MIKYFPHFLKIKTFLLVPILFLTFITNLNSSTWTNKECHAFSGWYNVETVSSDLEHLKNRHRVYKNLTIDLNELKKKKSKDDRNFCLAWFSVVFDDSEPIEIPVTLNPGVDKKNLAFESGFYNDQILPKPEDDELIVGPFSAEEPTDSTAVESSSENTTKPEFELFRTGLYDLHCEKLKIKHFVESIQASLHDFLVTRKQPADAIIVRIESLREELDLIISMYYTNFEKSLAKAAKDIKGNLEDIKGFQKALSKAIGFLEDEGNLIENEEAIVNSIRGLLRPAGLIEKEINVLLPQLQKEYQGQSTPGFDVGVFKHDWCHSEQKMMYYLLRIFNWLSFMEELNKQICEKKYEKKRISRVILNFHSLNDTCLRCGPTIIAQCFKTDGLRSKLLGILPSPITFNIISSYSSVRPIVNPKGSSDASCRQENTVHRDLFKETNNLDYKMLDERQPLYPHINLSGENALEKFESNIINYYR